ncbi:hypothetical protein [Paraburkholderia sp. BCC1886]|uniref:hypothetical protein n=1 Tax=Paraburkholderia sp. BCC1886 TaxID=2562670 RepID=UPI001181E769|nr:hypothetical protein [Paraburkholderia sp. BCC1886]
MRRIQPTRYVAEFAARVRALTSSCAMRLPPCNRETVSLAAAFTTIAVSSLAFWLSQPATLFNGGATVSARGRQQAAHQGDPFSCDKRSYGPHSVVPVVARR